MKLAALEMGGWFNHYRLLERIGRLALENEAADDAAGNVLRRLPDVLRSNRRASCAASDAEKTAALAAATALLTKRLPSAVPKVSGVALRFPRVGGQMPELGTGLHLAVLFQRMAGYVGQGMELLPNVIQAEHGLVKRCSSDLILPRCANSGQQVPSTRQQRCPRPL